MLPSTPRSSGNDEACTATDFLGHQETLRMGTRILHAVKVDRLLVGLMLGLSLTLAGNAGAGCHRGRRPAASRRHDPRRFGRGDPVVGDVAVRDGRIVAVGKVTPGKIGRTIDCRGLVVAPGLIDLHTHTDGTLGPAGRSALPELPHARLHDDGHRQLRRLEGRGQVPRGRRRQRRRHEHHPPGGARHGAPSRAGLRTPRADGRGTRAHEGPGRPGHARRGVGHVHRA